MPGTVFIESCETLSLAQQRQTAFATAGYVARIVTGSVEARWYNVTGVATRNEIAAMRQGRAAKFIVIATDGT